MRDVDEVNTYKPILDDVGEPLSNEVTNETKMDDINQVDNSNDVEVKNTRRDRPQRKAALNADLLRKLRT